MLSSGRNYIAAGLLEFALLQVVIAAEVATVRFVQKNLQAAGVSKNKLDEYQSEMTFATMLNIDLFPLCPPGMKPDRQVLGMVDRGRKLRNDVMHEATFNTTAHDLRKIHESTVQYIEFLNKVLSVKGLK